MDPGGVGIPVRAGSRQKLSSPSLISLLSAPLLSCRWSMVRVKTCEVGTVVKNILIEVGFSADSVAKGSHSLEAAKYGLDQECRRVLGYHRRPADSSVAAYERDEPIGPLRRGLSKVRAAGRDGPFNPDSTCSGYFHVSESEGEESSA